MANTVNITLTNTFEEWRVKDNQIGAAIGDIDALNSGGITGDETIISALNALRIDADNNDGRIGNIGDVYGGYTNTVEAINNSNNRLNAKDTEIGTITDLFDYSNYPSLVLSFNHIDQRLGWAEDNIGIITAIDATLTSTNLVDAINANKGFIDEISAASGISLTTTFGDIYDGTQTSVSDALNNDYARLNKINSIIGGTQSDGTTIDFDANDLYGSHTNLVDAINGIENFNLSGSYTGDGTTLIGALNDHDTRLDTEESNVDAIQSDIGNWDSYNGSDSTIVGALNTVKARQDNLTGDFVDASGDTMTGTLVAHGGVQATGQYLNLGVNGTETIRINTSNRIGVGKAAHSSHKVDVSGTVNATEYKVAGTTMSEYIADTVGGMVTSNSESGISVTYQDSDNTLDFNVSDPTITLSGDVTGSATMTNLGSITINTSVAAVAKIDIYNVNGTQVF